MPFPYNITRADWEEPGYRIYEHTNARFDWSQVTNITLHYPGTTYPTGAATRDSFVANLRSMQRYYVDQRRYSLGYNAAVWDNLTAEIRGEAFRCAANGNFDSNNPSFAIQIRSGGSQTTARGANAAEIANIRKIVAWAETSCGRRLEVLGHRDHKSTGCPGDAIYAQIQAGAFRPQPAPTPEEPDMAPRFFKTSATSPTLWVTTDGVTAAHVAPQQWAAHGHPTPVVLSAAEAAKFAYLPSLQHDIAIG